MKNKESKKKKKKTAHNSSPNEGDMTKTSSGAPNSNLLQLKSIELTELVPNWLIRLIKCDAPFPGGPVDHRQPAENLCASYRETHS